MHAVVPSPGRITELSVLVFANLAATMMRFALLNGWVFRVRTTTRSA